MAKPPLTERQISTVRAMRQAGHTLVDIRRATLIGTSTIHKYTRDISFAPRPRKARTRRRPML